MPAEPQTAPAAAFDFAASGKRAFAIERDGLDAVAARIDGDFSRACRAILDCRGRVACSGMGKSGHVARKIAATLASTGTAAFYVHPGEAAHGDLGMVTDADIVLALSYSGESDELLLLLPALKRQGNLVIAMTGRPDSTLAREADIHLDVGVPAEACPLRLAPTAMMWSPGRVRVSARCTATATPINAAIFVGMPRTYPLPRNCHACVS